MPTTKKRRLRRMPAPEYVPPHLVTPMSALNTIGGTMYGFDWTGQEIDADESDPDADERLHGAWRRLRDLLCSERVRYFNGPNGGLGYAGAWAEEGAYDLFNGLKPDGTGGRMRVRDKDRALVSRDDLEKALAPKVDAEGNAEDVAHELTLPPYMKFMERARKELGLPKQHLPKSDVEEWLRENWPDDLERKSNRKITAMATLIRDPDAQRGGFFNSGQTEG